MSDTEPRSDFGRFLSEMKRRHVGRFAITYAAVAFVLLQLAEIVFPAFGIGEAGLRLLVAVVTLGFIPAVVLAWIYDITKEGIRRTDEGFGRPAPNRFALLTFALVTIALTGAVGWYLAQQGFFTADAPALTTATRGYDPSQPIRSLVVLPLQDFSPQPGQGYIASGMHDEIISKLSTLDGVRVVSRTTSMSYADTNLSVPQIGSELGVDVVIEGSVVRSSDQIRITLQIIHAATDASVQTLQIDGSADDLLGLQEEAARRVAAVIGSTYGRGALGRTAEEIPRAAQDAYYQARFEMERRTSDAYRRARELFQEAVRLAPGFAEARAGLAAARFRLALLTLGEDPEARRAEVDRAEREAAAALALDSTSMEVREVYEGIRTARARAVARSADGTGEPTSTLAASTGGAVDSIAIGVGALNTMWLASMSTLGQQIQETLRDSLLAGPEAAGQLTFEARVMMAGGGFGDAVELLDSVVVAYPQTQEAWDQLLRAHVALGHLNEAVRVVERWNAAGAPGAPGTASLARLRSAVQQTGARGYWQWRRDYLLGQRQAGRDVVLTDLAAAHAAAGDSRARVYELLGEALAAGESRLYALPSDPVWDPLRGDPRFREIEEEVQRRRLELSLEIGTNDGVSGG